MKLSELIAELQALADNGEGDTEVCSWSMNQLLPIDSPSVMFKVKGARDRLWSNGMSAATRGKKIIFV